jgi:sulfite reductase beta subunit-like hemoprotein
MEVKAVYTVPELALAANTTRFRMARLLASYRVNTLRSGRAVLVPVSELKDKVPDLWASIVDLIQAHIRAEERAKAEAKLLVDATGALRIPGKPSK